MTSKCCIYCLYFCRFNRFDSGKQFASYYLHEMKIRDFLTQILSFYIITCRLRLKINQNYIVFHIININDVRLPAKVLYSNSLEPMP